jgi:diguanylate cyclase (GGDEF)-like protein
MDCFKNIGKIGWKIYRFSLITLILGFLMISGLEVIIGYYDAKEYVTLIQQQRLVSLSGEIQNTLNYYKKAIINTCQSKGLLESGITERFRFYLFKLLKNYPGITEVSVFDEKGNQRLFESRFKIAPAESLKNFKDEEFFVEAAKGNVFYEKIAFEFEISPYLKMSVPIRMFDGQLLGVLSAKINLKEFQKYISDFRIGETGYGYITDSEGNIIAHQSLRVASSMVSIADRPLIRQALAKTKGIFTGFYKNTTNHTVLGSVGKIPETGWVIGISQPISEVFRDVYTSIVLSILGLLLTLLIAAYLALKFSRKIAEPIIQLHDAAVTVSGGNFDVSVNIKTGDELENFGEKFNDMVLYLKEFYNNLEKQVSDRTRDVMLLFSFTSAVSQSLKSEEIIKIAGKELIFAFDLNAFVAFQYRERSMGEPIYENLAFDECAKAINFLSDEGVFDLCFKERKSITMNPLSLNVPIELHDANNAAIEAIALFPIFNKGIVSGLMILFSDNKEAMTSDVISMTDTCMLQLGVGIANAELYEQTQELSLTDPLTRLRNRRFFEIKMDSEFTRYKRYARDFSLVMLDIDHFKKVNDTFGHQSGDRILQQLGVIISEFLRKSDIPSRYGGEEFALLLPETPRDNANLAAERLRKKIEAAVFKIDVAPYEIKVTVSMGCAGMEPEMGSWEDLLKKADDALYKAKESGRNRVVCV